MSIKTSYNSEIVFYIKIYILHARWLHYHLYKYYSLLIFADFKSKWKDSSFYHKENIKWTNAFGIGAYTLSHFSYAPLVKCKIIQKR